MCLGSGEKIGFLDVHDRYRDVDGAPMGAPAVYLDTFFMPSTLHTLEHAYHCLEPSVVLHGDAFFMYASEHKFASHARASDGCVRLVHRSA